MPTFRSRLVGSTVIVQPDPKQPICRTLRFLGNPKGFGYITTEDPDDIKVLMDLVKNPQAQVELDPEAAGLVTSASLSPTKPVDPALAAAVKDATTNTEKDMDPAVAGLRNNLADLIRSDVPAVA